MPESRSTVIPALRYRDAHAAIEWFSTVFGFERKAVYDGPNGTVAHAELTLDGGMIMLGSARDDEHQARFRSPDQWENQETRTAYILVTDAEAAYERAVAAGATILRPLKGTEYGSREFALLDPEGHSWGVGSYDPWAAQG